MKAAAYGRKSSQQSTGGSNIALCVGDLFCVLTLRFTSCLLCLRFARITLPRHAFCCSRISLTLRTASLRYRTILPRILRLFATPRCVAPYVAFDVVTHRARSPFGRYGKQNNRDRGMATSTRAGSGVYAHGGGASRKGISEGSAAKIIITLAASQQTA